MKRISWKKYIDPYMLSTVEAIYNNFFSNPIVWNSLFVIPEYSSYLEKSLSRSARTLLYKNEIILKAKIEKERKRLRKRRSKSDYLFTLIPKWAHEELNRTVLKLSSGCMFTRRKRSYFKIINPKRVQLTISFQNILCLVTWKYTIAELVKLALLGDNGSTFKLVQLNKIFATSKWVRDRIGFAQTYNDRKFLISLGNAIKREAPAIQFQNAKIGTAALLLWFSGFQDLPKRELYDYLSKKGIVPNSMTQNYFNLHLFRIGIKRYS